MVDLRNDLARSRDAWMASDEGARCASGIAQGQYLRNRLQAAFVAGWAAREHQSTAAKKGKR